VEYTNVASALRLQQIASEVLAEIGLKQKLGEAEGAEAGAQAGARGGGGGGAVESQFATIHLRRGDARKECDTSPLALRSFMHCLKKRQLSRGVAEDAHRMDNLLAFTVSSKRVCTYW
jgi:hypothetical protein